ncbi:MAG: hypothetical protein ACK5LJ_08120 [Paracoccus sp. (in: a-proteobacteria)]
MSSPIYIVKPCEARNKYGELTSQGSWLITFYCPCVEHYPSSSKETIEVVGGTNGFEGVKHLETAWIEMCKCPCMNPCDVDIYEGYFAYIGNKYWKIVGSRTYNDCACPIIRLTLERLTPRETSKKLIECVDCFDTVGYVTGGGCNES